MSELPDRKTENGVRVRGFEILEQTGSSDHGLFSVRESVGVSSSTLEDAGFYIFKVAGVSHRAKALQSNAIRPGNLLTLMAETDNQYDPNAVGVWSEGVLIGYVPRERNQAVLTALAQHPEYRAVSLREYRKARQRVGLLVVFGPMLAQ